MIWNRTVRRVMSFCHTRRTDTSFLTSLVIKCQRPENHWFLALKKTSTQTQTHCLVSVNAAETGEEYKTNVIILLQGRAGIHKKQQWKQFKDDRSETCDANITYVQNKGRRPSLRLRNVYEAWRNIVRVSDR